MDFNMPLRRATRQRYDKKINAAQKDKKIGVAISICMFNCQNVI